MNEPVKEYLTKADAHLPYCKRVKKELLSELSQDLEEFAARKAECSFSDLCREFGDPEKSARDLMSREGFEEELEATKKKAKRKTVVFAVIIAALVAVIAFFTIEFIRYLKVHNGTVTVSEPGVYIIEQ